MISKTEFRAVSTLMMCQLFWISGVAVILTLSGIVGFHLAVNKSFATLPFGLMCIMDAAFSLPASKLMLRKGRRLGFLLGASLGCLSGLVSAVGIFTESFFVFCVGVALWGLASAFGQFYRYAVAEAVRPEISSRAISMVIASGIVAVVVGPEIAIYAQDWFPTSRFAGSFLALSSLSAISLLVISTLKLPPPASDQAYTKVPLKIALRPSISVGLINGAVGYAIMIFVMTASPLAVTHVGHAVSDAAKVVQWHLIGMYATSIATGWLIHKFGDVLIIFFGLLLLLLGILTGISGTSIYHFSIALLLLGIGWNFLYVTSTVQLSAPADAAERARIQAANEVALNLSMAIGAFSAGTVFVNMGWIAVNLIALPLLLVSLAFTVRYALSKHLSVTAGPSPS